MQVVSEKQMLNAWFCFLRKTEAVGPRLQGCVHWESRQRKFLRIRANKYKWLKQRQAGCGWSSCIIKTKFWVWYRLRTSSVSRLILFLFLTCYKNRHIRLIQGVRLERVRSSMSEAIKSDAGIVNKPDLCKIWVYVSPHRPNKWPTLILLKDNTAGQGSLFLNIF